MASLLTLPSIRDHRPSGNVVQIVRSGFDQLQNVDEVSAPGVEFGRATVPLPNESDCALDLLEAVLKDSGEGVGGHSSSS